MNDAQKLLINVLAAHTKGSGRIRHPRREGFLLNVDACGCQWVAGEGESHLGHLAAEIDKALGGLTREKRDADDCDCGNEAHPSWCDDDCVRFDPDKAKSRWVSAWSEVQS